MSKKASRNISVNGVSHSVMTPNSEVLSTTLRDRLGLISVKVGCGRGECGSCTVLVRGRPQLSCLLLTARADNIWTMEGLHDETEELRRKFAEYRGYQCGFCTPGQILSGYDFIRRYDNCDGLSTADAMSGNICRCTGYRQLLMAISQCANKSSTAGDAPEWDSRDSTGSSTTNVGLEE